MPYRARHLCRKESVQLAGHPVTAATLCTDKQKLCTEQDNNLSLCKCIKHKIIYLPPLHFINSLR